MTSGLISNLSHESSPAASQGLRRHSALNWTDVSCGICEPCCIRLCKLKKTETCARSRLVIQCIHKAAYLLVELG